jgi:PIN domain nuclease of toxin-antitoxin system
VIHLDTHVLAWLAGGHQSRIPAPVLDRIESEEVAYSPMTRLELSYLHEIGRIAHPADRVLAHLRRSIGAAEDGTPFSDVVEEASRLAWTRDPFDRLIAAQAIAAACTLATGDRVLREALPGQTLWGTSPQK